MNRPRLKKESVAPRARSPASYTRHWRRALRGRRIVVASNRAPLSPVREIDGAWEKGIGGLVAALGPAMEAMGGTWVSAGHAGRKRHKAPRTLPYALRTVPLTPHEEDGYYLGYANRVLWPICHLRLERVQFREEHWREYMAVNARFADALAREARKRASFVWIHDYHLALAPRLVRERLPQALIALFWHIPWPSYYLLRTNPTRRALLEGMLGADLVAFQTPLFARNFLTCCTEEFGAAAVVDGNTVRFEGHTTRVEAFGISIDVDGVERNAGSRAVARETTRVRARYAPRPGMKLVLGVDRLDYAKGVLRRLQSVETFFQRYPRYRRKVTFVQVAGSTRSRIPAYLEYRSDVVRHAEEVNRRIGSPGWQPVHLVTRSLSNDELHAHYRAADALLVTSVADGMNLVAKEFIASQADDRGVPIVSEMAGVSEELVDVVRVNPFDIDGVARAIRLALEMPVARRRALLDRLRELLRQNTVYDWLDRNLSAVAEVPPKAGTRDGTRPAGQGFNEAQPSSRFLHGRRRKLHPRTRAP